jgi:hypothetical protein
MKAKIGHLKAWHTDPYYPSTCKFVLCASYHSFHLSPPSTPFFYSFNSNSFLHFFPFHHFFSLLLSPPSFHSFVPFCFIHPPSYFLPPPATMYDLCHSSPSLYHKASNRFIVRFPLWVCRMVVFLTSRSTKHGPGPQMYAARCSFERNMNPR